MASRTIRTVQDSLVSLVGLVSLVSLASLASLTSHACLPRVVSLFGQAGLDYLAVRLV